MIASLKGTVIAKGDRFVVVETTDGVGYRVFVSVPLAGRLKVKEPVHLFIHQHVDETALDLYGFPTLDEREFFEQLLSVAGVGPKSALTTLSQADVPSLKRAIIHGDPERFAKVAGVGRRTAEKIVVDLKEKVAVLPSRSGDESVADEVDALDALVKLGWPERQARAALRQVPAEVATPEGRVKAGLKILGKRG